eukprot:6545579-Pyramimonas_sp.AAC.1
MESNSKRAISLIQAIADYMRTKIDRAHVQEDKIAAFVNIAMAGVMNDKVILKPMPSMNEKVIKGLSSLKKVFKADAYMEASCGVSKKQPPSNLIFQPAFLGNRLLPAWFIPLGPSPFRTDA